MGLCCRPSPVEGRDPTRLLLSKRVTTLRSTYALPVLRDLGQPWTVHLPLLAHTGNWGSQQGDPPAEPRYTEVQLSPLGALVLAAERGEVGPVPVALVDGSLYRGGRVPPLGPAAVGVLRALVADPTLSDRQLVRRLGRPVLPSGGLVEGTLAGLYAGRRTRLRMTCRFAHERDAASVGLVVVGVPLGVPIDELARNLAHRWDRVRSALVRGRSDGYDARVLAEPAADLLAGVLDVVDESTQRRGVRVVVRARSGTDLDALEDWARTVWPLTLQVDVQLLAAVGVLLRSWADRCRAEPSGLDQLAALLSREPLRRARSDPLAEQQAGDNAPLDR